VEKDYTLLALESSAILWKFEEILCGMRDVLLQFSNYSII
jgi:hypothetical protein